MVKRQTVWLSTMMVLSLMLIGYYTLGTPPTQNANSGNSANPGTTVVSGSSVTVPASTSTATSGSDWFAQATLNQTNKESQVIQTLQQELTDTRLTSTQTASLYNQITTIQKQQQLASTVHQLLLGQGYADSIVYFVPNQEAVQVVVEASKLDPLSAVKVINTVSQALGIQATQVKVSYRA